MVLELNEREKEILKRALQGQEDELKTIRVRTDKRELRAAIHDEEDVLERILKKVA